MKKAIVFGLVGTNIGGIETFLLNMNEAMDEEYVFDYVVEEKECIHEERIFKKGGKVFFVPCRKNAPIRNSIGIFKLLSEKKNDYKAAYFNLSSLSWIMPELIAKFLGYSVFVHSHNSALEDKNSSVPYRLINKINKYLIEKMQITRLACSESAAEFMFGKNKETMIVRNGISVNNFAFRPDYRKKWRDLYHIGNGRLYGFTGRLTIQKNPLFLVEIFSVIKKSDETGKLLIVGDGNLRRDVEQLCKEKGIEEDVIFAGNTLKVNELYNAMDFFILPSRHEGLGIVLIEAQTNGLQGITSSKVVPKEAFISDLFEVESLNNDAEIWASHILKMLKEKTETDRESYMQNTVSAGFEIREEARKLQNLLFNGEGKNDKRFVPCNKRFKKR